MSNQQDSNRLTPQEIESLLNRLLESEQFRKSPILEVLLRFLFENAIDGPVPGRRLIEIQGLGRKHPEEALERLRVTMMRVKDKLSGYFGDNLLEPVCVRVPDADNAGYKLEFAKNRPSVPQDTYVDRFWLPFIAHKRPVSILIDPESKFIDSRPKSPPRRGSRPVSEMDSEKTTYLPAGLLESVLTINKFLSSKGTSSELLWSEPYGPATNSILVLGESPFAILKAQDFTLPVCEDGLYRNPLIGSYADHFREENGKTKFCCFARVLRLPMETRKGFVVLQIRAHHSVAIEAVVKFLVSAPRVKHLHKRLEAVARLRPMLPERDAPRSREMEESIEELGLLFRITCNILEGGNAPNLRPGVPRVFLEFDEVELLEVFPAGIRKPFSYDPATRQ